MIWLFIIIGTLFVGLILYWQFILAEGAYFGSALVALLYDWTAERYNSIKEFNEAEEDFTLGRPLANRLHAQPEALVLDVATGTGRLAFTLLRQPNYRGRIIGLDRASKMLAVARRDLEAQHKGRVMLVQADAMALPFADNSLPAITNLEAIEFYPDPKRGLAEMIRVLQPVSAHNPDGGWLLTTNRIGWEAKLMPGKTWSRSQLKDILDQLPLRYVDIQVWETIYDLIWAQKIEEEM
ncbi:MAG TPA: methyltransferase domain-containing protein [Anaerolineae bacterium]|nr:methyltransferase domain-containing protein [Anaerolineae bacterium]MCB9103088.1 methyltransferase domain-containing protein [Anaerolineales bacterium]HRV95334.1 methyltransferase domain-containing protein [Anaerolineae bacterium]